MFLCLQLHQIYPYKDWIKFGTWGKQMLESPAQPKPTLLPIATNGSG